MRPKEFILKSLRSVRDFIVNRAKWMRCYFSRQPSYEFSVNLLDGNKVVFKECEGVIMGEHKNLSRVIEIDKIDAVGYMTFESNPVLYDFFFLFNSEDVTYMIPTEWPHVHEVIVLLEKTLPGYNTCIEIANSIHYTTLAVWPPSLAGGKFPLQDIVFPPIFNPWEEDVETKLCQKGLAIVRRH